MIKRIFNSFALAIHNIRSHFFHTLLSVLGIVIGVASLVAILSLIDGMEDYARKQITETTSLKAISIKSDVHERINNVRIRKDSFAVLTPVVVDKLVLSKQAEIFLHRYSVEAITIGDSLIGTNILASTKNISTSAKALTGKLFSKEDVEGKKNIVLVNEHFANKAWPNEKNETIVGKTIPVGSRMLTIQAILENNKTESPYLVMPITLLTDDELKSNPPELIIEAGNVEDVTLLKEEALAFLKAQYPSYQKDFSVFTNEYRVKQAAQGFLLFRIIMGLIVGISVLVGGIGVMNVLLISVNERTVEIGIRKAVGANRTDIVLQFLSESVTISAFGSLVGLLLGVTGTMAVVPIVRSCLVLI